MNGEWSSPLEAATALTLAVLGVSIGLCTIRLARGPSLPDRVVGLDMVAILLVGLLVVFGMSAEQPESLRVATVLSLINFIGTVGFAAYVRRRAGR